MRWFPESLGLRIAAVVATVAIIAAAAAAGGAQLLRGPAVGVGDVPARYELGPLATESSPVELAEAGMARLAGTVAADAEVVVVSASGESVRAIIDRSVDPPVWNALIVPPEGATVEVAITATSSFGRSTTITQAVSAIYPGPEETVLHPNLVVLNGDGPALVRFDQPTGEVEVSGAARGEIREQSIVASGIVEGVAEYGLLRRVSSVRWDGSRATLTTAEASLDDAVLQGDVTDPPQVIVGGRGKGSERPSTDFDVFFAPGISDGPIDLAADGALGELIESIDGTQSIPAGDATIDVGVAAELGIGLDLDLDFTFRGIFAPPVKVAHFSAGIDLDAGIGVRLRTDAAEPEAVDAAPPVAGVSEQDAFAAKGLADTRAFKKKKDLFERNFPTWQFMVGVLPVVIVPQVMLTAIVEGEITPDATVGVAGTVGLSTGIIIEDEGDPRVYAEPRSDAATSVSLALSAESTAQIELVVSALAYDSFGPTFTAGVALESSLSLVALKDGSPEWGPGVEGGLEMPLTAKVGVRGQVPVVDVGWSFDKELYDKSLIEVPFEWYPFKPSEAPPARPAPPPVPTTIPPRAFEFGPDYLTAVLHQAAPDTAALRVGPPNSGADVHLWALYGDQNEPAGWGLFGYTSTPAIYMGDDGFAGYELISWDPTAEAICDRTADESAEGHREVRLVLTC